MCFTPSPRGRSPYWQCMFCHGLKKKRKKKTLKTQQFTLGFPAANYPWIINAKSCHQAWSLDGRLPGKLSTPGHARRGVWKGKRKKNTLIVEGQSPTLTSHPASVPAPGGHRAPSASQPRETTPRGWKPAPKSQHRPSWPARTFSLLHRVFQPK